MILSFRKICWESKGLVDTAVRSDFVSEWFVLFGSLGSGIFEESVSDFSFSNGESMFRSFDGSCCVFRLFWVHETDI